VLVEEKWLCIEALCRIVPRGLAARQLKRLHVVGAGAIEVSNSCIGRVLDECSIVEASTRVVSGEVEIVVAALSTLVRLDPSLEAVVRWFAGGSESRGGNRGQGEEGREVVHVGYLFWRQSMSITERLSVDS
jgi:hypothetical protein